jgi:hypothetical protein
LNGSDFNLQETGDYKKKRIVLYLSYKLKPCSQAVKAWCFDHLMQWCKSIQGCFDGEGV